MFKKCLSRECQKKGVQKFSTKFKNRNKIIFKQENEISFLSFLKVVDFVSKYLNKAKIIATKGCFLMNQNVIINKLLLLPCTLSIALMLF